MAAGVQTHQILLLNKPFQVLSQFTDRSTPPRATLAELIDKPGFYPAGRLDYDSEGLLLLSNSGSLQARVADPAYKLPKRYWVQVEGQVNDQQLAELSAGVALRDGITRPAKACKVDVPSGLWPRKPAVTEHRATRSNWLNLEIQEGKNRQVRRMCAHVGLPVLRLIRHQIGPWSLGDLQPGEFREETINLPQPEQARQKYGRRRGNKPSHRQSKKPARKLR